MAESISVVFPMFNEEEYINKAVTEISYVLKDITSDYEIIIVNDASTDRCGYIAEELSRQNKNIKIIHHKKNRKLGGALKTGFTSASKDIILYSDVDIPFDFREIKKALNILNKEKADLVCAYRLNRGDEGIKRYIYHIVYNIFIRIVFNLRVKDVNFSFKMMRNDFLKKA